jgi:hypothetical protein
MFKKKSFLTNLYEYNNITYIGKIDFDIKFQIVKQFARGNPDAYVIFNGYIVDEVNPGQHDEEA